MSSPDCIPFLRRLLLGAYETAYLFLRYALFRVQANTSHELVHDLLERWDGKSWLQSCLRRLGLFLRPAAPVRVGGVDLPQPFILAAGWCKGQGYDNEVRALATVVRDGNLLPGWRTWPHLVGPVECGSLYALAAAREPRGAPCGGTPRLQVWVIAWACAIPVCEQWPPSWPGIGTCYPRSGVSIWRLPRVWQTLRCCVRKSLSHWYIWEAAHIMPDWLTLNVSCPSNDEDAGMQQSEAYIRGLLEGVQAAAPAQLPIWLKVSPGLAARQYNQILLLSAEFGVQAIVATNTHQEKDESDGSTWGVSGGILTAAARAALIKLVTLQRMHRIPIDIIACGGIGNGRDLRILSQLQVRAWQYQSALVYRGPLAATLIYREAHPATA